MSKPTGKLAFAYQSIANLENKNNQLKDRIAELERERDEAIKQMQKAQAISTKLIHAAIEGDQLVIAQLRKGAEHG